MFCYCKVKVTNTGRDSRKFVTLLTFAGCTILSFNTYLVTASIVEITVVVVIITAFFILTISTIPNTITQLCLLQTLLVITIKVTFNLLMRDFIYTTPLIRPITTVINFITLPQDVYTLS